MRWKVSFLFLELTRQFGTVTDCIERISYAFAVTDVVIRDLQVIEYWLQILHRNGANGEHYCVTWQCQQTVHVGNLDRDERRL